MRAVVWLARRLASSPDYESCWSSVHVDTSKLCGKGRLLSVRTHARLALCVLDLCWHREIVIRGPGNDINSRIQRRLIMYLFHFFHDQMVFAVRVPVGSIASCLSTSLHPVLLEHTHRLAPPHALTVLLGTHAAALPLTPHCSVPVACTPLEMPRLA